VYYRKEELDEIRAWLAAHYDTSIKSVSFLLHADHNFPLPPYEEITEDEYKKAVSKIDFTIQMQSSGNDVIDLDDCATGACPVK
jgi:hypothetical protein